MKINIPKHIIHTGQSLKNNLTSQIKASGHNITSEQWKTLNLINEYDEITQVQLGMNLDKAPPAISKIVAKLQKMKLIKIINNGQDKREKLLQLSAKGNGIIEELNSIADKHHKKALKGISVAECKQLINSLIKIKMNLENNNEKN